MSRKKEPDNTETSLFIEMLRQIQDEREKAWIEKNKNKTLPKELLELKEITDRCTQHVEIYDGQAYPKEMDRALYTFGDAFDSVIRNAIRLFRMRYIEKSDSDEDGIFEIVVTDSLPTERDFSISGVSGSTLEHPIAGPSSAADLSNFSNTTGDNSLNPLDSVNNKFEKDRVPTGAMKREDANTQENFIRFLERLSTASQGPVIENCNETNESDFILSSDETNSSDSESIDEDSPEYEKRLIICKMRNMKKYGYKRMKNDMGRTYYWKIRPENRKNDFRVYPEENTMLTKEKPTSDSQNLRQPERKISAESPSKLSNQKNLIRNTPDNSLAKSSTSSGKQKGQFGNKRKKSISSTESPVKKVRKISRNVSHVAKNKIMKPTTAVQLKQSRSQLFNKSKSLMKEGNLFLSESTSTSDQQKIPPKSTRVSAGSSKKVKLQSSKKSILAAEKHAPSKNTGFKFKKISEKTRQKRNISLNQSAQFPAMKLYSRSRLKAVVDLLNKRESAKDSSIQKAEGKEKNISSQSSKSKCIKKGKKESVDPSGSFVTRQRRSVSKKGNI